MFDGASREAHEAYPTEKGTRQYNVKYGRCTDIVKLTGREKNGYDRNCSGEYIMEERLGSQYPTVVCTSRASAAYSIVMIC